MMDHNNQYNIFDIIGYGKYHSCVILGYSFDPIYCDRVICPTLKKRGITNIIFFIDSSILTKALNTVISYDFAKSEGYTVSPIRCTGAFHPKIIQLFGEKEGLFSVGSGNPTYSGYSSNLETWLSFHVKDNNSKFLYLFLEVWKYVKRISQFSNGLVSQKLQWIQEYCLLVNINQADVANTTNIQVLVNYQSSIFNKTYDLLQKEKIIRINIVSPFFDSKLQVIHNLIRYFHPESIHIFIQPEMVSMEKQSVRLLPKSVIFHDFNEAYKNKTSYTHSKIIEFKTKQKTYYLLGSGNLSIAALGTKDDKPRNEEIMLFKEENDNFSLLQKLDIIDEDSTILSKEDLISRLNNKNNFFEHKGNNAIYFISEIDQTRKGFNIYTDKKPTDEVIFVSYDSSHERVLKFKILKCEKVNNIYKIEIPLKFKETQFNIGYFINFHNDEIISNRAMIHNVESQLKNNPNPTHRKLQTALTSIEMGDSSLWDMFKLLDPNKYQREAYAPKNLYDFETNVKATAYQEDDSKILSYNDFITLENQLEDYSYKYFIHKATLSNIMQILQGILGFTEKPKVELSQSAEIDDEDSLDQFSEGVEIEEITDSTESCTQSLFNQHQKHANSYFNKYIKVLIKSYEKRYNGNELRFALQAISTYLLVYYTLTPIQIENSKRKKYLFSFHENRDNFISIGLRLIGCFYSKATRKSTYSKKIVKNDYLLASSIEYAAINSMIITVLISYSLRNGIESPLCDLNACKIIFMNIFDITKLNAISLEYDRIEKYIERIFKVLHTEYLTFEVFLDEFNIYWNYFLNHRKDKKISKSNDIDKNSIVFSNYVGYTQIRNWDSTDCYLREPGCIWCKDTKDFISQKKFNIEAANLYLVEDNQYRN